jgi:hypothetical protein
MADKNFTQFDDKLEITRDDFVVGYDQSGTHEIRSKVGNIADLTLDAVSILIQRALDELDIGRSDEFIDGDGDFIGVNNILKFTASSIQRTITYDGSAFSVGTLSLLKGHNYDLDITSSSNSVAIRKTSLDNLEPCFDIFGNDTVNGITDKLLMWTPPTAGTYYLVDINDTTKNCTITVT